MSRGFDYDLINVSYPNSKNLFIFSEFVTFSLSEHSVLDGNECKSDLKFMIEWGPTTGSKYSTLLETIK